MFKDSTLAISVGGLVAGEASLAIGADSSMAGDTTLATKDAALLSMLEIR